MGRTDPVMQCGCFWQKLMVNILPFLERIKLLISNITFLGYSGDTFKRFRTFFLTGYIVQKCILNDSPIPEVFFSRDLAKLTGNSTVVFKLTLTPLGRNYFERKIDQGGCDERRARNRL